jgi:hypothetical protein
MNTENLFIVYAKGRGDFNGWAAIKANTKAEAKKNAYSKGWLEEAKVVDVRTFEMYTEGMTKLQVNKILKRISADIKKKGWYELEWGT